jgi:hypothetical protein
MTHVDYTYYSKTLKLYFPPLSKGLDRSPMDSVPLVIKNSIMICSYDQLIFRWHYVVFCFHSFHVYYMEKELHFPDRIKISRMNYSHLKEFNQFQEVVKSMHYWHSSTPY